MMNKNLKNRLIFCSKAFTLVELLAIIVILAIIAVITIPIILDVIDRAHGGTVIDSAYGYRDAVHKYYLDKISADPIYIYPNGVYVVNDVGYLLSEDDLLEIQVAGDIPEEGGWVKIEKGEVKDFSLKFGDYVVNYDENSNSAHSIKNGSLEEIPVD